MLSFFRKPFQSVSACETAKRRAEDWAPFVLDVRPQAEADLAQIPGTDLRHEYQRIAEVVADLPRDRDLLVYCKGGVRSAKACRTLANAGFDEARLFNLADGIDGWTRHVDPTVPAY